MRKTKVKEKIREIKDEKKQLNKPKPIPAQKPINQSVPTNNINIEPATKKCPWDGVIPLPPRAHAVVLSAITTTIQCEMLMRGTFQQTLDEIYQENNLPKVKFPQVTIMRHSRY